MREIDELAVAQRAAELARRDGKLGEVEYQSPSKYDPFLPQLVLPSSELWQQYLSRARIELQREHRCGQLK